MTPRRKTDNTKAPEAFLTAKTEIDTMLARLVALSDDHFDTHPDVVNWGHVGSLNHYACAFHGRWASIPRDRGQSFHGNAGSRSTGSRAAGLTDGFMESGLG